MAGAMVAGQIAGSVIGGAMNIAAAKAGQPQDSPGNQVFVSNTPAASLGLQGSQFDALGRIGFADPSLLSSSGPFNRLAAQIQAMPIGEKIKRRALGALGELRSGNSTNVQELDGVLGRLGIGYDQVDQILQDQRVYDEQVAQLQEEYGPMQQQVIRDRLSAASDVSSLAASLAGGSSPVADRFRQQFMRDRTQGFKDAEEAALLRSQFGGINPASTLSEIDMARSNMGLDAELYAIQQALTVGGGINSLLQPGSDTAQNSAGLGVSSSNGALGIAASQASAANALSAQNAQVGANNLASGLSYAGKGFGEAAVALGDYYANRDTPAYDTSTWGQPVDSYDRFYSYTYK